MLKYPGFNPIALEIGPVKVHWYGIMYLLGFAGGWWLARLRAARPGSTWKASDVDDLIFYNMLGVILGGRIGYVLFYGLGFWAKDIWYPFKIWEGGMSFHGGMLGVILAMSLFGYQRKRTWMQVTDFVAPLVPLGLAAGRFGNFINGELWGRVTNPNAPWAMLFQNASPDDAIWLRTHPQQAAQWNLNEIFERYQMLPRHPSQLYEIALEGFALFIVMWLMSRKQRPVGGISAVFLIGYGLARFTVEFAREPDDYLGLLAMNLSMGQWLSLPMIIGGIGLLIWSYRRGRAVSSESAKLS